MIFCISLTQLGLILDICGAIGILLFGMPPGILTKDLYEMQRGEDYAKYKSKIIKLYKWLTRLSATLLILGFLFQLIGSR